MRVLHYLDSPELGGCELAVLQLVRGLAARGCRSSLLVHRRAALAPLLRRAREAGCACYEAPPVGGVRSIAALPAVVAALRAERPDVFHAHCHWQLSGKLGLAAAAACRVPAVVATVQLFAEHLVGRSVRWQMSLVARGVDRYIAVSRDLRDRLWARFELDRARVDVIHNAIDPGPFEAAAPPPEVTHWRRDGRALVLVVARLAREKGHLDLLEAVAALDEVRLLIAGDGPERAALERRVLELRLDDRVVFLGCRDDVPSLLAACDVFVLPSLAEGLPISVLEAMAAARPIVASAIGGVEEAVVHGESALLVPPRDPAALGAAVRLLLRTPALSRALAANALERVRTSFTAESMTERVLGVYRELLSGSAGRSATPAAAEVGRRA